MFNASPKPMTRRSTGFTLMEALVVLAISAILVAIAMPSFNASIARARTSDAVNTLVGAIDLARSEAIRRGTLVTACRVLVISTTEPKCTVDASTAYAKADWASGWVIYVDINQSGAFDKDEPVIAVQEPFEGGATAPRAQLLTAEATSASASFRPDGTSVGSLGFAVAYPQAALGAAQVTKTVAVSVLGQVTVH